MPRPLTRNQQLENAAFLRQLRLSGNVRLAARAVGKAYSTMQHRRAHHPVFATHWDAALASAQARLYAKGGLKRPEARAPGPDGAHRTAGGEPVVVALRNGQLQVRAAHPGKLTRQCEQAFLLALSATCNIRLSAAAAGASEAAFNRRRRRSPAFAREMRMALQEGYARLKEALLTGFLPEAHADDAWRHNDAPDMPAMTAAQALQLLYLHHKEAVPTWGVTNARRRRPGETWDAQTAAVRAEYAERMKRQAEDTVRESLDRLAVRLGATPHAVPVALPQLDQVTGWSKADPDAVPHEEGVALFGGWRVKHLTEAQLEKAARGRRRRRG